MLSGACIPKRQRAGEIVSEVTIFDLIWLSLVRRTGKWSVGFSEETANQHGRAIIASQRLAHVFGKPQTFAERASSPHLRESQTQAACPAVMLYLRG